MSSQGPGVDAGEFMGMAGRKRSRIDAGLKVGDMKEDIDASLARLEAGQHPVVFADTVRAVRDAKDRVHLGEKIVKTIVIPRMTAIQIQDLANGISSSSNSDHRVGLVAKTMFGPQLEQMQTFESKIAVARTAIRSASELALLTTFGSESGVIEWSALHSALLKQLVDANMAE